MTGQSVTTQYTTVAKVSYREEKQIRESFFVCFDNKPCYSVDGANDAFYQDFEKKQMPCLADAKERY